MKRDMTTFLVHWLHSSGRKPLVMRGARQVGKTWIIRDLAHSQKKRLVEINFEKRPEWESLFTSNDPEQILLHIGAVHGGKIEPEKTILFLDEIQVVPHLLEKLRWFAEDMPELPVIAAGSLLDFAIAKHEFSMPVGRIGYAYLEPLSFEEFLEAIQEKGLRHYLQNYDWDSKVPEAIHMQLIALFKEYLVVGGMPAATLAWADKKAPEVIAQIHVDLLTTYRDDFAKYSGRLAIERLNEVMRAIPRQLGKKFVYREVNADANTASLKQALDLLVKARVCHQVVATSANGLPLGAEADEKFSKVIMLDCGLSGASLGLSLYQLQSISELSMINNGGMAEQVVGQLLRTIAPPYISPSLYYWQRVKKGADAEVDYIIQFENQIIPIEVKAGTTGTLRSLHQFMKEKKKTWAIRVNSDIPRLNNIEVKDSAGSLIAYQLFSLPFYLLGQLNRLIKSGVER